MCKDLTKIAKADATANTARILSVILIAMQTAGALGADDGHDDGDDESFLERFLNCVIMIVGYGYAAYDMYPGTVTCVLQVVMILACLLIATRCFVHRPSAEASPGVTMNITCGTGPSEVPQASVPQVPGAKPKGKTKRIVHSEDERAQSPGAHEAPRDNRPGSSTDGNLHVRVSVSRADSEQTERSSNEVPNARPIPRRRTRPQRHDDGVWVSTSQLCIP